MRFKPTRDNLVLHAASEELTFLVPLAVSLLVPRHTRKVYLLSELESFLPAAQEGLVVVKSGNEPSNFLESFRLLLRDGELVVVSSSQRQFTSAQWRNFAEALTVAT